MTNKKVAKLSIAFSPVETRIVKRVDKIHGLNNFSAALRLIVREWDRLQGNLTNSDPKKNGKEDEVGDEVEVME